MKYAIIAALIIFPSHLFSVSFETMPVILIPHINLNNPDIEIDKIIKNLPENLIPEHNENNFSFNIPKAEFNIMVQVLQAFKAQGATITEDAFNRLHYFMFKNYQQPTLCATIQDGNLILSKKGDTSILCGAMFSLSQTHGEQSTKYLGSIQLQPNLFTMIIFGIGDIDQNVYIKTMKALIGYLQSLPQNKVITQNEMQETFNQFFKIANRNHRTIQNFEQGFSAASIVIIDNNHYLNIASANPAA